MGEDRQVRRDVRLAHRAKHFPFIRRDLVPRSDLAEGAKRLLIGLPDERLDDLLLAHRRDLFRVERLVVEAATGDDRYAGLHRDLAEETDVAPLVGVTAVDDAREVAVGGGLLHFSGHQIRVAHDVETGRRRRSPPCAAAARGRRRKAVRRANRSRGCLKSNHEIRRELHVLMKQRGAAGEFFRHVVFEHGADDRAPGKHRRLSKGRSWKRSRGCAHPQQLESLTTIHFATA